MESFTIIEVTDGHGVIEGEPFMRRSTLNEAQADHIVKLPKFIEGQNTWELREDRNLYTEMPVKADEQLPLQLYGRLNPRTGHVTFILFYDRVNLRRLDIGKRHHNPTCEDVGTIHKHTWTDEFHDKWAYEPPDIEEASTIREVFTAFLAECNIAVNGRFVEPPQEYQEVLL